MENGNILSARGEVDLSNVGTLLRALTRLRDAHETIILDMGEVTHMDSAGFGALLRVCRELRHQGGRLVLRRPSPHVQRMLELMGLLQFFAVDEDTA